MHIPTKLALYIHILLIGLLSPILVQASCESNNIPGTWMTYGVSGDTSTGEFSSTDRCKIKVNSSGNIVSSSSSCKYRDSSGAHKLDVDKGTIEVNSNCVVTGYMRLCKENDCARLIIDYGTLSMEHNVFSIVGYSKLDPDFVFSFTGIKR